MHPVAIPAGFELRAIGNHARVEISPQRDHQSSRDGDNPNLARAGPTVRIALLIPLREGALRLILQPAPRQLDRDRPNLRIARLTDPLVPIECSTLPRRARQARQSAQLPAIPDLS